MTAKELVEAANRLREQLDSEWPRVSVDIKLASVAVNHILATVRHDDDEPVTVERLESDGWLRNGRRFWRSDSVLGVSENSDGFWLYDQHGSRLCRLKSMGHLRRLVAALGE